MGTPNKVIIDLDGGYLLVSSISAGSTLGVLTSRQANLGNLAYEMAVFANRAGEVLSPNSSRNSRSPSASNHTANSFRDLGVVADPVTVPLSQAPGLAVEAGSPGISMSRVMLLARPPHVAHSLGSPFTSWESPLHPPTSRDTRRRFAPYTRYAPPFAPILS